MTTIRRLALTGLIAALAACGADGEPERPDPRPVSGISITGTAGIGITGRG